MTAIESRGSTAATMSTISHVSRFKRSGKIGLNTRARVLCCDSVRVRLTARLFLTRLQPVNTMKPWMRWTLVLPAAIGAYLGVLFAIGVVSQLSDILIGRNTDNYSKFINCFAAPCAFVWCGAKTAPKWRAATSASLATLFSTIQIVLLVLIVVRLKDRDSVFWWGIFAFVAGVAASIFTSVQVCEDEKQEREEVERAQRRKERDLAESKKSAEKN